jgi:hypothetical protein
MKTWKAIVLVAVLACGCQKAPADFSRTVEINKTVTSNGDTIVIDEVRGPADQWVTGQMYEVRGKYTLTSREKATLGAFATTPPGVKATQDGPDAVMTVQKGSGEFRLRFRLWSGPADCPIGQQCIPGVSLYPIEGGDSFLRASL